jgi:hypothetical protein
MRVRHSFVLWRTLIAAKKSLAQLAPTMISLNVSLVHSY